MTKAHRPGALAWRVPTCPVQATLGQLRKKMEKVGKTYFAYFCQVLAAICSNAKHQFLQIFVKSMKVLIIYRFTHCPHWKPAYPLGHLQVKRLPGGFLSGLAQIWIQCKPCDNRLKPGPNTAAGARSSGHNDDPLPLAPWAFSD